MGNTPKPPRQPRRGKGEPRQTPGSREIIDRLVTMIRLRGLRYDAFESRCGLPQGRVTKWASGQGNPPADQVSRMAAELGVSLDYLIRGEGGTVAGGAPHAYELPIQLVHELGPEESLRRLLKNDAPSDVVHGKPADAEPSRRKGIA